MGPETLCALCVARAYDRAAIYVCADGTRVTLEVINGTGPDDPTTPDGAQALERMKRTVAEGQHLSMVDAYRAGVWAVTLYRGSALCGAHVQYERQREQDQWAARVGR